MEKNMKPCECGSTEFATNLNSYDIYELIDGKLEWIRSELAHNELKFYCRDCGEEYFEE
jgi:hypothetical protein